MGSTRFDEFCEALDKPLIGHVSAQALRLPFEHPERMVKISDEEGSQDAFVVDVSIINYGKYIKKVFTFDN